MIRRKNVLIWLLVCAVPVAGYLLFAILKFWFTREIAGASIEFARAETRALAERLGAELTLASGASTRSVSPLIGRLPVALPEPAVLGGLDTLLARHPMMMAAGLVDVHGRIIRLHWNPYYPPSRFAPEELPSPRQLRGVDEQTLIKLVNDSCPALITYHAPLRYEQRSLGAVSVLLDPLAARPDLQQTTGRLILGLTLAGLALAGFGIAGALFVRRQASVSQKLRDQRDAAENLAYVGTLAAGLAHEIRNPLNALGMQLEMIEEDALEGEPERVVPRLQRIRGGLTRVEQTVREFLNYAQPGQQNPTQLELGGTLELLARDFIEGAADPELRVERITPPELTAWCDPHALRQILGNLFSNGVRAQHERPRRELRIEATRAGNWIEILIDDAGPGVPPEHHDEIFSAFFTTTSDGTGLGLPIARRLARMNGGDLLLDPEPSPLGGARFRLRLPSRPGSPGRRRLPFQNVG